MRNLFFAPTRTIAFMILATTTVENVDRFLDVFGTKGAEKRALHGSKGSTVREVQAAASQIDFRCSLALPQQVWNLRPLRAQTLSHPYLPPASHQRVRRRDLG